MIELKNDRYLRTLLRQPADITSVWMMRQAGCYLPEYKAIHAQAGDFMSLCKNTKLAYEVIPRPLRRYPLDVAILFSDVLTTSDAMGLGLYLEAGEGPHFTSPIKSKADVDKPPTPDPEQELDYVMNAVRTIRCELKGEVPLIGFSGSPWAPVTYAVEGGSSKAFIVIKKMMRAEPQTLHAPLGKLVKSITLYLNAQIKAGAQSVMILDTWGGVLISYDYQQFSLYYMHKVVDGLLWKNEDRRVPVTLFTKGGGQWLEAMVETGCDALGFDWATDIADARRRAGHEMALQGNMNPSTLYAPAPCAEEEVVTILAGFGRGEDHVFNLGRGTHRDIDPRRAGVFAEAVHRPSTPYHQQEMGRMGLAALRIQQQQPTAPVKRAGRPDRDPSVLIGDVDVGFEQGGEVTRAAMVLLTWLELELVEHQVTRVATTMFYIPGFLLFRETPALLAAWEQLL